MNFCIIKVIEIKFILIIFMQREIVILMIYLYKSLSAFHTPFLN